MTSDQTSHGSTPAEISLLRRLAADPAVWLILAVTLARLIYLRFLCPYELVEDEAHYWEWSRRLGLSYYSKGPGVAWSIAAATKLLGTSEFAVRLPSVLAAAIGTWAVARLARTAFNDHRAGLYTAALYNLAPVFQFTSILMTIDGPYIACWAIACWAGWRSLAAPRNTLAWFALLGAALGIGFLFKYTILLLVPGLIIGTWLARKNTSHATSAPRPTSSFTPGLILTSLVFLICILPVLIWNHQQGWPTVRHLLGHMGFAGGDVKTTPATSGWNYQPRWTLELIGVQLVMLGAPIALIAASSLSTLRKQVPAHFRPPALFMLACSLPIFLFYLIVTLFTNAEGNWPMAGFVSLLPLAGAWTAIGMREYHTRLTDYRSAIAANLASHPTRPKMFTEGAWNASLWAGIIVGVLMLRVDLLARLPLIGPLVPIGRLIGARTQTDHIEQLRTQLTQETGKDPIIIVQHYGQASRLAFYLPGRPTILCASSVMNGRRTQYDYWPDTNLARPDLAGKPGILIGGTQPQWAKAFHRIEPIGPIHGETKKDRTAFLGYDYRGFARK
ncbi:MAG: glycosyltransferase family 39 protein [Phycisphaerales bacterium]|nr:glycosyltransferase family 39 protein [Phycisphaerales bacterium]